ncbi:uncharacterized protein EDB93DRAFT_1109683 [Suillus bovinus]|uniref:uncharacterized protein n=1 Tax=Suillus bovinus TaxID=48563 RepID=UPI001B862190|nr:uncharacterized protein EDB93DRAFT_1109683 [Suillus bovinus]KAG2126349.1 hypothetical protein EDB93DRAFT_1109683 [Suillus bovinus]
MPKSTDQNIRSKDSFEALLWSLDDTSSTGRKQKKANPLDPYLTAARFFRLNYDLFANIFVILRDGILAEFEPEDADHDQEQDEEFNTSQHSSVYDIRKIDSEFQWPHCKTRMRTRVTNKFPQVVNAARCDDTGSLKHTGLQYMLSDPAKDCFDPPILKSHSKALRGWNHPQTAQLLCPAWDITEFDMDPQAYMDKVNAGEKKISAKQWPSMFYDMSLYDPKNKKKGFLRSRVVIQAWRHIFIGPMSALSKDNIGHSSKPRKGKMHHLAEPGIRNIMYAACQMSFAASNAESWTPAIGAMDLGDLYYRAIDIVHDNAEQQWVKDLMKFWKDETPGLIDNHPSKRRRVAATDDSGTDDDMDDFFGDDTASADQHDEENETHGMQPINNGESAAGGSCTPNQSNLGGPPPPTPPHSSPGPTSGSSPAPPHTGSSAPPGPQREPSPLSEPLTTPAPVGHKTKRAAPVPRGGARGHGKAKS